MPRTRPRRWPIAPGSIGWRRVSDANEATKRASRTLARRDLEAADALGTDDPRLRYSLGVEWMLLGDLDRSDRRTPGGRQAAER